MARDALRAVRRFARDYALPVTVSLLLHAGVPGAAAVAFRLVGGGGADPAPSADLTLTLDAPRPPPPQPPARPENGPGADPLAALAPPRLPGPSAAPGPDSIPAPPGLEVHRSVGRSALADLARQSGPPMSAMFAGVGAERASSVAYVVDGSGAMVTSLQWVIDDLKRSLERLSPAQKFAIVIFRNRPPTTGEPAALCDVFDPLGAPRLLPATGANKRAAAAWLDGISPRGISNPSVGLRRALEFRPDIVFLLSRSIPRSGESQWEKGREAILAELESLNPVDPATGRRRVQVKTIQFIEEDPTGTMQAIGRSHGGEGGYTLVTLEEIGGR